MGLAGLLICWQIYVQRTDLDKLLPQGILDPLVLILSYLVVFIFCLSCFLYILKYLFFNKIVRDEIHHPVKKNFMACFTITLGLICGAILPKTAQITHILFLISTLLHLYLMILMLRQWIVKEHNLLLITPVIFIPIVGSIALSPVATKLGYMPLAWFFLATGILMWLLLFCLVFWRLVTQPPLPTPFLPSMAVIVAPPALTFLAFTAFTNPSLSIAIAPALFHFLFFIILISLFFPAVMLPEIITSPFSMSWWALSFPLAAFCSATQKYSLILNNPSFSVFSEYLFYTITGLIIWLAVRSLFLIKLR